MLSRWNCDSLTFKRWDIHAPSLFVAPARDVAIDLTASGHITCTLDVDYKSRLAWYVRLVFSSTLDHSISLLGNCARTVVDWNSGCAGKELTSEYNFLLSENRSKSGWDTGLFCEIWSTIAIVNDFSQISHIIVNGELCSARCWAVFVGKDMDSNKSHLANTTRAINGTCEADSAKYLGSWSPVYRVPTFVNFVVVDVNIFEGRSGIIWALNDQVFVGVWLFVEKIVEEDFDLVNYESKVISGSDLEIASRWGVILWVLCVDAVRKFAQIKTSSSPCHVNLFGFYKIKCVSWVDSCKRWKCARSFASCWWVQVEFTVVSTDHNWIVRVALKSTSDSITTHSVSASTSKSTGKSCCSSTNA